jgi:hypothetical protein
MRRIRSKLRLTPPLGLLALAAACVTVDGALEANGSATVTVSYPVSVDTEDHAAARALVSAQDVTIEELTVAPAAEGERGQHTAKAKLSTKDVTKLEAMPLFKVLGVSIQHERTPEGGGTLQVELKNKGARTKDHPEFKELTKYRGMLRLRMPGPMLETNALDKDGVVEWMFPAGDWSLGKTLALTVTYGPTLAADDKKTSAADDKKASAAGDEDATPAADDKATGDAKEAPSEP